jgi:hypothetical protein
MSKIAPHLITYPRSGSHYFDRLIYKEANFHIERSHTVHNLLDKDNNKRRAIVTIARDPKDSISSYVALEKYLSHCDGPRINQIITEYVLLYSFLYDHADIVIDFKDLVEHPDQVTKKTLNLLDINKENSHQFVTDIDYNSKNFVESSKELKVYADVDLTDFNIDLCYFYYNRLLEKKIVL